MAEPGVFELLLGESAPSAGAAAEAAADAGGLGEVLPGQWQRTHADGEDGTAAAEVTVWRVQAGAPAAAAVGRLAGATGRLAAANAALPVAQQRLAAVLAPVTPGVGLEDMAPPPAEPEAALAEWLWAAEHEDRAAEPLGDEELPAGLSGLIARIGAKLDELRQLGEDLRRFYADLRQALSPHAVVETVAADGRVLALTRVAWRGDVQSAEAAGLTADEVQLVRASVGHVLATRTTWLRIGVFVASLAASIATVLAGNPLSFAAAWGFIKQIIAEVKT